MQVRRNSDTRWEKSAAASMKKRQNIKEAGKEITGETRRLCSIAGLKSILLSEEESAAMKLEVGQEPTKVEARLHVQQERLDPS